MKQRVQLGAKHFEKLQIIKFAWRNNVTDLAFSNSAQIEEIDNGMKKYKDLLAANEKQGKWDQSKDEISS